MKEIEAGPLLDAEVAEKVFGLEVTWSDWQRSMYSTPRIREGDLISPMIPYSRTGDGMVAVLAKMREQRFSIRHRFCQALNDAVNDRALLGAVAGEVRLAWPAALFWLTPEMVALAAVAAMERGSTAA